MADCCVSCLDGLARCISVIFERHPLPRPWSKTVLLAFIVPINLFFLTASLVGDWILFAFCMNSFKNDAKLHDDNSPNVAVAASANKTYEDLSMGFYVAYLTCTIVVSVLLVLHVGTSFVLLYLKKWNPPLCMWLELLTLLLGNTALPTFVCLMLMLTPLCIDFSTYQWQMLMFALLNIMACLWSSLKLVNLGLCCCCCATCCTTSWPLYRKMRKGKRGENLMTQVLRWMPVDSESSTWAQAGKWCFLSMWTFPLMLLALTTSTCLIVIVAMNKNFLFPYLGGNNDEESGLVGKIEFATDQKSKTDKISPLIQEIISRQRENQGAVKKLKTMLAMNEKRKLHLNFVLKQKKDKVRETQRQNSKAVDQLKSIETNLPKVGTDDSSTFRTLDQCFKQLKVSIDEIDQSIRVKEELLFQMPQLSAELAIDKNSISEKHSELKHLQKNMNEVQNSVKNFLKSSGDYMQSHQLTERFFTFPKLIEYLINFANEDLDEETENDELKKSRDKLKAQTVELHKCVEERRRARDPLVLMEKRIRNELEHLSRRCNTVTSMPNFDANTIVHLTDLYLWAKTTICRCEKRVNELIKKCAKVKTQFESSIRQRNLTVGAVNDDIRFDEDRLAKLEDENRKLRRATDLNAKTKTDKSKTKQMLQQIKLIVSNSQFKERAFNALKVRLQSEIDDEDEECREMRCRLEQLLKKKENLEEAAKKIEIEIRNQNRQRSRNKCTTTRPLLLAQLDSLKVQKATLLGNVDTLTICRQQDECKLQVVAVKRRRLLRIERMKREYKEALKELTSEVANIRRSIADAAKHARLVETEINRKRRIYEMLKRRMQHAEAKLKEIEDERKKNDFERLSSPSLVVGRPSSSAAFDFEQKYSYRGANYSYNTNYNEKESNQETDFENRSYSVPESDT